MYDVDWTKKKARDYFGYKLDAIFDLMMAMKEDMMDEFSELRDSVGTLVTDIQATLTDGAAASAALHAALDTALATVTDLQAGKVLEDAQIADLQAQLDAAKSAATDTTAIIKAVDDAVKAADAGLKPAPVVDPPADGPLSAKRK